MAWLPDSEKISMISLFILAQLTNVTDRQKDKRTDGHRVTAIAALCIASYGKNRRFHVPQPTFLFPLETSLRLSRNTLHGWKDNSVLAKLLAVCTYLYSIVSELYDD